MNDFSNLLYYKGNANSNKTYLIRRVSVRNLESLHSPYHRVHCHEDILIDKFDKTSPVLI